METKTKKAMKIYFVKLKRNTTILFPTAISVLSLICIVATTKAFDLLPHRKISDTTNSYLREIEIPYDCNNVSPLRFRILKMGNLIRLRHLQCGKLK